MSTRALGRTGSRVSELGLGTEHVRREQANCDAIFDSRWPRASAMWISCSTTPTPKRIGGRRCCRRCRGIASAWWSPRTGVGPIIMRPTDHAACFERVLALLGGQAEVGMMTMVDSLHKWETWAQPAMAALQTHKAAGRVKAVGLSTHYVAIARRPLRAAAWMC